MEVFKCQNRTIAATQSGNWPFYVPVKSFISVLYFLVVQRKSELMFLLTLEKSRLLLIELFKCGSRIIQYGSVETALLMMRIKMLRFIRWMLVMKSRFGHWK